MIDDARTMPMAGGHSLVLDGLEEVDRVELQDQAGNVVLRIHASADGAIVSLGEGPLVLRVDGPLAIEAEHVSIRGERGLELSTGGDARIDVAGDLESEARIQSIRARLGEVRVRANDDVRLNGERIKLNC
jgi:hypothetical protein